MSSSPNKITCSILIRLLIEQAQDCSWATWLTYYFSTYSKIMTKTLYLFTNLWNFTTNESFILWINKLQIIILYLMNQYFKIEAHILPSKPTLWWICLSLCLSLITLGLVFFLPLLRIYMMWVWSWQFCEGRWSIFLKPNACIGCPSLRKRSSIAFLFYFFFGNQLSFVHPYELLR